VSNNDPLKEKKLDKTMYSEKVAIITGITGQDGSYLCELLLSKGYLVHGLIRRASTINTERIDHLYKDPHVEGRRMILHYADMSDQGCLTRLVNEIQPDEIYNLAAQSHVKVSFDMPVYTSQVDALGPLYLLEAIRQCGLESKTKFYQASTSEMYGKVQEIPQSETTPFYPRSPYGSAKVYAYWIVKNYRESYGIFACNGILFNHSSPRRGHTFIIKKVCRAVAQIKKWMDGDVGPTPILYVGNLSAQRDWGHAKDYCKAMVMMLDRDSPEDYVIATGEMHTVREVIEEAFKHVNIIIEWKGELGSMEEYGVNKYTGDVLVKVDPKYFRPNEVDQLLGDPSKAKRELGWEPSYTFDSIIDEMIDYENSKI